jgi:HAD superfamily, subfamily IIIB (Acid phosphatase)
VIHSLESWRRKRPVRAAILAVVAIAATFVLLFPGAATALLGAVAPPPANPTSADQIQNIDQVKTAIKAYYGDTPFAATDPVTGLPTTLHTFSPTGAYANEMSSVEADAANYLDKSAKHEKKFSGTPAVLFDVDDTTLNTYSYELYSNFVFNPASNAAFVNSASFPAVPGMPALATHAAADGYAVFFLTGRPEAQRAGTVTNLTNAGYTVVNNQLYLKDQVNQAWLSSCSPACTTTQYKSLTRQHIESLGYDIVANFGDQFSDLNGGFADATFKVPNPMYFLP